MKYGYEHLDWKKEYTSEDTLLHEKIRETVEKRKQIEKNLKMTNAITISAVDAIATINDKTSTINSQLNILKENIEVLESRIEALERTAADRCGLPKRPRKKLTIKVSA